MSQKVSPGYRPGPSTKGMQLSVGPNGRHLVDQRGQPWFYLADTAWNLFKRLNRQEIEDYLQNRVAKGFTIIQAYLLRGLRVPNLYGDRTVLDGDVTKPNEPFFRNVDDVVERANELGLVLGIVVTYGEQPETVLGVADPPGNPKCDDQQEQR